MKWFGFRPISVLLSTAVVVSMLIGFAVSPAQASRPMAARAASLVKTSSAHILVSSKGRTLYVFAQDKKNRSTCNGLCATVWPPVLVPKGTKPATHVSGIPGVFGVATRNDGTKQLTYHDAPLYTYSGDSKAGQMNGQGIILNGGFWWVVVAGGM